MELISQVTAVNLSDYDWSL